MVLYTCERLQTHLGLELRQMHFALFRFSHWLPVSLDSVPSKHLFQIPGQLHRVMVKSLVPRFRPLATVGGRLVVLRTTQKKTVPTSVVAGRCCKLLICILVLPPYKA